MGQPTHWPAIDVDELYIAGQKFDGTGKKIFKVSPLKAGADTDTIVKKINELIGALKAAGLMENE